MFFRFQGASRPRWGLQDHCSVESQRHWEHMQTPASAPRPRWTLMLEDLRKYLRYASVMYPGRRVGWMIVFNLHTHTHTHIRAHMHTCTHPHVPNASLKEVLWTYLLISCSVPLSLKLSRSFFCFVSDTVINTMIKSYLGRRGFIWFMYPNNSWSLRETNVGTQARAKTMWITGLPSMDHTACFFI